jgi:hypothetical protein
MSGIRKQLFASPSESMDIDVGEPPVTGEDPVNKPSGELDVSCWPYITLFIISGKCPW